MRATPLLERRGWSWRRFGAPQGFTWVRHLLVGGGSGDDRDGAGGVVQDSLADRAEEQAGEASASAGADDDGLGVPAGFDERVRGPRQTPRSATFPAPAPDLGPGDQGRRLLAFRQAGRLS